MAESAVEKNESPNKLGTRNVEENILGVMKVELPSLVTDLLHTVHDQLCHPLIPVVHLLLLVVLLLAMLITR
jgi:hypothetical protein